MTTDLVEVRVLFNSITKAPGWTVLSRSGEEADMRASKPVEGGTVLLRITFLSSLPTSAARGTLRRVSGGGSAGGDAVQAQPPAKSRGGTP